MIEIVLKGDLGRTDIFIILSFHFWKHSLNLILSDYAFTISLTDVIFVFLCHPFSFFKDYCSHLTDISPIYTETIFAINTLALWIPPLQYFTYNIFIIYSLYISSCPHSHTLHLDISNSYNNCNSFNFLSLILLSNDNLFVACSLRYTNHRLNKNILWRISLFFKFACMYPGLSYLSLILWSVLLKRKHSLGLLQATMDYVILNLPSLHKQL